MKTPVELTDLAPTVLEAAGKDVAPEFQGFSLLDAIKGGDAPEREWIFAETGAVKMLRSRHHKLVFYPGQTYGELYDLQDDRLEMNNVWDDPQHAELKTRMIVALLERLIETEAAMHGESMRGPAYWKTMYRLPFED